MHRDLLCRSGARSFEVNREIGRKIVAHSDVELVHRAGIELPCRRHARGDERRDVHCEDDVFRIPRARIDVNVGNVDAWATHRERGILVIRCGCGVESVEANGDRECDARSYCGGTKCGLMDVYGPIGDTFAQRL